MIGSLPPTEKNPGSPLDTGAFATYGTLLQLRITPYRFLVFEADAVRRFGCIGHAGASTNVVWRWHLEARPEQEYSLGGSKKTLSVRLSREPFNLAF